LLNVEKRFVVPILVKMQFLAVLTAKSNKKLTRR